MVNQGRTINEDDALYVEFSMKAKQNNFLSRKEGKPVWENSEYVKIVWDNEDSVLERPLVDLTDEFGNVTLDEMKVRFADKYKAWKEGLKPENYGTSLTEIFPADPARVKVYERSSIYSVEQLAAVSDSTVQSLGMGAMQDRKLAIEYLEGIKRQLVSDAYKHEMAELSAKNQDLADKLAETNAALAKLVKEREKELKKKD